MVIQRSRLSIQPEATPTAGHGRKKGRIFSGLRILLDIFNTLHKKSVFALNPPFRKDGPL